MDRRLGGRTATAAAFGLALAALCALYWPVLLGLVRHWSSDLNYSHGFIVTSLSGYLLWSGRKSYAAIEPAPCNLGLLVVAAAVLMRVAGSLAAELLVMRVSLVVWLAGAVLFLWGRQALRAVAFPIGYLLLAIPLPALVETQITVPLQLASSRLAAAALDGLGIVVLREGNVLYLRDSVLEVAGACSGIRSLMALTALAVAYGYFAEPRNWVRLFLLALVAPLTVATNALRVFVTGVMTQFAGPEWAEGSLHTSAGVLVFLLAAGLLAGSHRAITAMRRALGGGA